MIERSTLNDEPCTVAYLDDEFNPCDKDDATLAKVICDDGRIVWLSMRDPDADEGGEAEDISLDAAIDRFFRPAR
jgi:hypothetical protein